MSTAKPTTPSLRKLFGTILLLAFIIIYVLLAMAVAMVMQVNQVGPWASLAYHALAGLLWVPPAALIITWMQREPAGAASRSRR
jgi:hypothetical protein